jgi:hypothetical protein
MGVRDRLEVGDQIVNACSRDAFGHRGEHSAKQPMLAASGIEPVRDFESALSIDGPGRLLMTRMAAKDQ